MGFSFDVLTVLKNSLLKKKNMIMTSSFHQFEALAVLYKLLISA